MTRRSRAEKLSGVATPPRETDFLWPDEQTGPWWVHIWWRIQHGVPTPVGMSLRSWVEEEETADVGWHNNLPSANADAVLPRIDARLMRNLPTGALLAKGREQLAAMLRYDVDTRGWSQEGLDRLAKWRESIAVERAAVESGRRGRYLGDEHYRDVADAYASAVQEGRNPTAAVAEHFTVSKSAAAKKVARAREAGFLPATTKGRIGPLSKDV